MEDPNAFFKTIAQHPQAEMLGKLRQLGLRLEGDFELSSGIRSDVKWDIERLFEYPDWVIVEALRTWLWDIGLVKPRLLVGIPTGGLELAKFAARTLSGPVSLLLPWERQARGGPRILYGSSHAPFPILPEADVVMIDDVLSTGATVREGLGRFPRTVAVAVLVNRSGLQEIDGIPLISGVETDYVEVE